MGCTDSTPGIRRGNPAPDDDLFRKVSSYEWGDLTAHVDFELPAIIVGIRRDNARGLEVLVAPGAALDFALCLVGACERLARARADAAPRHPPRRRRIGGAS
jgi:hypothetical protein